MWTVSYSASFEFSNFAVNQRAVTNWEFWYPLTKNVLWGDELYGFHSSKYNKFNDFQTNCHLGVSPFPINWEQKVVEHLHPNLHSLQTDTCKVHGWLHGFQILIAPRTVTRQKNRNSHLCCWYNKLKNAVRMKKKYLRSWASSCSLSVNIPVRPTSDSSPWSSSSSESLEADLK